jgi:hypothetical protein
MNIILDYKTKQFWNYLKKKWFNTLQTSQLFYSILLQYIIITLLPSHSLTLSIKSHGFLRGID